MFDFINYSMLSKPGLHYPFLPHTSFQRRGRWPTEPWATRTDKNEKTFRNELKQKKKYSKLLRANTLFISCVKFSPSSIASQQLDSLQRTKHKIHWCHCQSHKHWSWLALHIVIHQETSAWWVSQTPRPLLSPATNTIQHGSGSNTQYRSISPHPFCLYTRCGVVCHPRIVSHSILVCACEEPGVYKHSVDVVVCLRKMAAKQHASFVGKWPNSKITWVP